MKRKLFSRVVVLVLLALTGVSVDGVSGNDEIEIEIELDEIVIRCSRKCSGDTGGQCWRWDKKTSSCQRWEHPQNYCYC